MTAMSGSSGMVGTVMAMIGFVVMALLIALMLLAQPIGDLELPRPVPTVARGLSPEHHGELNRMGISAARYYELRREYEGNLVAQQQIDVYDPATEYHKRMEEYIEAVKSSDEKTIEELESWFGEHYPDIHLQVVQQSSAPAIEWTGLGEHVVVPPGMTIEDK